MIDIATVVFEPELPVLEVQAQSVDLFCRDLGIKNVWVVVNDTDQVAQRIDPAWWGSLQNLVRVIPRSQFGSSWVDHGWVSQQVLKLLAATLSQNIWSMILDAKTIVNNYVRPDLVLHDNHSLKLGVRPILPVFQPAAKIASDLFGISVDHVAQPAGVPFFLHTQSVKQMISCIESLTGQMFTPWFQDQGMLTEFILYTAYIKYQYQDLSNMYKNTTQIKLCNNICHSEWQNFDNIIDQAKKQRPLTVGVHRHAWSQLTQPQKQNYIDYLCEHGITKSKKLL
jgi:hypothetical protein